MTYYLGQLALWTLSAWFVGCIFGSLLRSLSTYRP